MEYGKIISVTGMPGLYELLSSKNDGAIVRSLDDKTTKFVSSRVHNFSHLESIEIYTVRDNVNLVEVFQAMDKSSEKLPDGKDAAKLKKYFETVYPDIDFERVYNSDLKKMAKWLQVLKLNDVELKLTEYPEAEETSEVEEEEVTEAKPAKKTAKAADASEDAPKKKATAKASEETEEEEAKPAKKAAKASEETEEAPKKKAAPKAKKEEDETKEPVKKKAAPKKKS
ncbi:MAG: hypothetical protein EOO02_08795 [Chitinophagaceae bacterium]|nr:MAG: hypothetical protein EOO02_08795 [Chitinophagaceae bacterium]